MISSADTSVERRLEHLASFNRQRAPRTLDDVAAVAQRLSVLPPSPKCVVVAGTNGKGSCAVFLESLLRKRGLKVGTTLSPHVERFNERIRIDGLEVESQRILTALERVEDHRLNNPLTYFDYATLCALLIFREESVDVSVLEVGLGGRLDAVNAVDADLAVITNIGLDHQGVLGTSRSEIGTEKAGVVRPGIPVVLGAADMPTSVVDKAQINECPMYVRGREFDEEAASPGDWHIRLTLGDSNREMHFPAVPRVPKPSAIAAIQAAGLLYTSITDSDIRFAIEHAFLPARVETFEHGSSTVVLDVAHNRDAAAYLRNELSNRFPNRRVHCVCGFLRDKDVERIVDAFRIPDGVFIVTDTLGSRGMPASVAQNRFSSLRNALCEPQLRRALDHLFAHSAKGDVIVVFGSFDVVARARQILHSGTHS